MAGNKFATMLHRKTPKIGLILTYAILEWILILLLLVNSLLSYLIIKFAAYFGLKPPCLWCSRVDHIIDSDTSNEKTCYRDLMCDAHASEISQLGYCSRHKKLVESHDMCEDCSSSKPDSNGNSNKIGKVSLFSWNKDMGMISCDGEKKIENGEKDLQCSCCDVSFEREVYSPYVLFKPSSWGVLDYIPMGNLIKEGVEDGGESSDPCKSNCPTENCDEEEYGNRVEHEENGVASEFDDCVRRNDDEEERESCLRWKKIEDDVVVAFSTEEKEPSDEKDLIVLAEGTNVVQCSDVTVTDASFEVIPLGRKNFSDDLDDDRFVSIELIDSITLRNKIHTASKIEKHTDLNGDLGYESLIDGQEEVAVDSRTSKEEVTVCLVNEREEDYSPAKLESMNVIEKEVSHNESRVEVSVVEAHDKVAITQATQALSRNGDDVARAQTVLKDTEELAVSNVDALRLLRDESTNHTQVYEPLAVPPSRQSNLPLSNDDDKEECLGVDSSAYTNENDLGLKQAEMLDRLPLPSELHVVEEESVPETPTYPDGLHNILHKKSSSFDRKESGTEESLDGSVISEIENGEGSLTVERLKSALKAEHKALTAVYAELEEERSASAIAANQTMAMITRLQEEKAIMQMESLQYQRMMEEQSEYDQEALQLMNELVLKREKEKQELEKELEVYRKKVLHYEAKQKRMMRDRLASSDKSRTSSVSSSNVDSDELSVDLNHEAAEEDNFFGHQENNNQKTPPDAVVSLESVGLDGLKHLSTLDESLADFEDERQSILEQLKALEEKLFTLGDENEPEEFEDVKPIQHMSDENGKDFSENYEIKHEDVNGFANGLPDDLEEKHYEERRNVGVNAKRLLPLFDAIGMDNGDEELNEEHGSNALSSQNSSVSKFTSNDEKLAIEEEVDHVYERLQALEADREFLKHCVGSLKKGDKGMDLLQEILQHLRDLRTVELRVKSMSDLPTMS